MTVKISGGCWRGRPLRVHGPIRPTESRVREALFSILGEQVVSASFADLFAGSGAVGFEALSRGAAMVHFVDNSQESLQAIRQNARNLGLSEDRISAKAGELPRDLDLLTPPFDVIFLDPPYSFPISPDFLSALVGRLKKTGILVYEHSRRQEPEPSPGVARVDFRRYGESALSFFEASSGENEAQWHG